MARYCVTGSPQSGQRKGRRLAMARRTANTTNGNPILGISLLASTVPWVAQRPVCVSISVAMAVSFFTRVTC